MGKNINCVSRNLQIACPASLRIIQFIIQNNIKAKLASWSNVLDLFSSGVQYTSVVFVSNTVTMKIISKMWKRRDTYVGLHSLEQVYPINDHVMNDARGVYSGVLKYKSTDSNVNRNALASRTNKVSFYCVRCRVLNQSVGRVPS